MRRSEELQDKVWKDHVPCLIDLGKTSQANIQMTAVAAGAPARPAESSSRKQQQKAAKGLRFWGLIF